MAASNHFASRKPTIYRAMEAARGRLEQFERRTLRWCLHAGGEIGRDDMDRLLPLFSRQVR
jgi:hypothetical protein